MSVHLGDIPIGTVIPHFFGTYGNSDPASITMSGIAVTDIEIYKGTSMTQRASDNGYALLDTDGIDLDGTTGIHGFSIDTSDNSDSGFYAAGSIYHVVIASITVDSKTVNFVAYSFRAVPAESVAGKPKVDVDAFGGTAGTFSSGRPEVNASHISGSSTAADNVEVVFSTDFATNYNTTLDGWNVNTTHWGGTSVASATVSANVTQISGDSGAADNAEAFFDGTGYAGTNNVIPTVTTVTNVTTVNGLANNVITAAAIADGAFDRATFAADTGLQSVRSNTAQAGGAGTITLDASASATNEFYAGMVIYLTGGTGAGQFGIITEYNATTKVATVHQNWKTNPDNTTTFAILPYGIADTQLIDGRVLTASSAITVGAYIGGTAAHSTQTSVDTIDDFLDTEIVALTTELAKVPKSDSNVTWNATAAAQIQSEANDALTAFWTSPATLVDLVWDEATSGHTTAGTTGKAVADAATGASPSAIADAVWDEVLSGHLTAGTTGNALNAAGSAGDPWSTTLPGAYTGSQAGALLDNIYDQVQQQILVSPVAGNSPERITDTTIRTYSGETVAVQVSGLDEDGDTIDWTALGDLVFVVENELNTDILEIENADITKTATYFQVTIPAATNVADHSYRWAIRKVSTKQVFLRGRLICERAPDNDA